MQDSPTILRLDDGRLSLEHQGQFQDRDFGPEDTALLARLAHDYQQALPRSDVQVLLALGRRLYDWLDRDGWLRGLRPRPPWLFELQTPAEPRARECGFLAAPWELLADDKGFLAARPGRQYAPYRRLGAAADGQWPLSDYRLGLLFMAAAPRGEVERAIASACRPRTAVS